MPVLLPLLAFAVLAPARMVPAPQAGASVAAYSLAYKPVADEILTYEVKIEAKVMDMAIESTLTSAQKVLSIEKEGGYTLEVTTTPGETKVNGEVAPEAAEPPKVTKSTYNARGHEVSSDPDEENDGGVGQLFKLAGEYATEKDVKIGDEYTSIKPAKGEGDPLKYKVDRKEKLGDEEVLVLVGSGKGPKGETIEATHWVSPDRFILRKSVMKITGVDLGGATGDLTATVTQKKS